MLKIITLLRWTSLAASAAVFIVSPWSQAALLAFYHADPFAISQYRLAHLNPEEYAEHAREALAQNDADDARAIAQLAKENGVKLPGDVQAQINGLEDAWLLSNSASFGKGFVFGSVGNGYEMIGSIVSDFMVLGDLRDAGVNGYALATGGEYDNAIMALSLLGIVTTATYVIPVPGIQTAEAGATAFKTSIKVARASGVVGTSGLLKEVTTVAVRAVDFDAVRRLFSSSSVLSMVKMPSFSDAHFVVARFQGASPMQMRTRELRKLLDGLSPVDTKRFAEAAKGVFRPGTLNALEGLTSGVSAVAATGGLKAAVMVINSSDTAIDAQKFAKLAAKTGKRTSATVRLLGKNAIRLGDLIWTVTAALITIAGWLAWAVWLTLKAARFALPSKWGKARA